MRKSRFTAERIFAIPREQEAGVATTDVCRGHGISNATFVKWKAKSGGMGVPDAGWLKQLEDEDAVIAARRAQAMNVSDNGTELTSMAILRWSQ